MNSVQEQNIWLTEKQVAAKLNCSISLLQKKRHFLSGIPYSKFGHNVRYSLVDVEEYMKNCRITHTA